MRMTRLLFTALVVLLQAWPATATALGPRFEVPVEWVWLRNPRSGVFVRVSSLRDFAVASNGTDFFVAWSQRALVGTVGPASEPPRTARAGVFGVRIDAAGNVLDAVPIQLPLSEVADGCPSGARFCPGLLSLAFATCSDSYLVCIGGCARVDSRGTPLDANPIPFLPSSGFAASDGQNHFVMQAGSPAQIFFVAPDATVVAHPIAFPLGSVASDGENFLSVTGSQITLFDTNGAMLNATETPFPPTRGVVTFDGNEYLFFWAGSGPDGFGKYVTRVSSDGEPIDTSARLALPDALGGSFDLTYRIAFDGVNAVAAWCSVCVNDRNLAPIAVIQKDDDAEDQIVATQAGTAGPLRRWLALASNSTGVSVVVVDGVNLSPTFNALESFFTVVQFVTTGAPPGRGHRVSARQRKERRKCHERSAERAGGDRQPGRGVRKP